jgi:hypothetical protein
MINFADMELLTFDCYGTLIDWENGIFSALRPVLAAHGKSIADADLLALYGEFEERRGGGISSVPGSPAVGRPFLRTAAPDSILPKTNSSHCQTQSHDGSLGPIP